MYLITQPITCRKHAPGVKAVVYKSINALRLQFVQASLAFCVLFVFSAGLCFAADESSAKPVVNDGKIRIVDDTGYELVLDKPATRLLALYGAFSEIMLALDLGGLLVGRTAADAQIEGLKHLPAVGTHMRPNFELILSLKPQVIIQFLGRQEAESLGHGLRQHGLPVLLFKMENFDDMYRVIEKLGELTGNKAKAMELVSSYKDRLGDLHRILLNEKRVRVFFEVRYPNLLGAGANSIVSDIIKIAGGSNVITLPERVIRINEEELIYKRPDVYIIQKGPMNVDPEPIEQRPNYATLPAVQNGRVLVVDQLSFSRPGPRAVDAAEMLAKWLHPTVNFDVEFD